MSLMSSDLQSLEVEELETMLATVEAQMRIADDIRTDRITTTVGERRRAARDRRNLGTQWRRIKAVLEQK